VDASFLQTIPILRIFDEAKAREFYIEFLGFHVDWEHRFEPDMPLYMQISRAGLTLRNAPKRVPRWRGCISRAPIMGCRDRTPCRSRAGRHSSSNANRKQTA
jgi:hypothetical protein